MVTIIDYGVGNLSSIKNMFKKIGVDALISNQASDIQSADKLILPGVGHFDYGMKHLRDTGLIDLLHDTVIIKKKPILGICLGVQLLTKGSEEGKEEGLGWIKGKTIAFDKTKLSKGLKIPHMGWAELKKFEKSRLFTGISDIPRFYFVHSYHLSLDNSEDVLAEAEHGYDFPVGVECENILGVQFHPEKSHRFGMKVLENYINLY